VRGYLNNAATNRTFRNDTFVIAPANLRYQYNRIDTFLGTTGTVNSIVSIERGGSSSIIKYRISNGQVNGINIDSLTGAISLDTSLNVGNYPITVTATNEVGSTLVNIIIIIQPNIDSIIGFTNSVFQTTTVSTGGGGDYITLPALFLGNAYTIETWFKNTGKLGGWNRVFDICTGQVDAPGIEVAFSTANELKVSFLGNYQTYPLPANFNRNGWNHFALSFDGTVSSGFYINGVKISDNSVLFDPAYNLNSCPTNYIGRSTTNVDSSTSGEFRDFRIWKKLRTDAEILSNMQSYIPQLDDALYYYLPLTNANKNNPLSTINIPNNTMLTNAALWTERLNMNSTITSQNNSGAKYAFNDSSQKIYGIYARDLQSNEILQFSLDTGRTWLKVDTAYNNQWIATLPASFRYGVIQVRGYLNNAATNR
ncbi:MAG: LamG domain-containing protein, partial [Sediminibacterium sp.]|nr:LamG domain-containing protein [Sediminibacterium sp.]